LSCKDVPKIVEQGSIDGASVYRNAFGENLSARRAEKSDLFRKLNAFGIGGETGNVDSLLVYGADDPALTDAYRELILNDPIYGGTAAYTQAQRAYLEGRDGESASAFLAMLRGQRQRLFFTIGGPETGSRAFYGDNTPSTPASRGKLFHCGRDSGRDIDRLAVRRHHARRGLVYAAGIRCHSRLLDADARSFRGRAIRVHGRAAALAVRVAGRDHSGAVRGWSRIIRRIEDFYGRGGSPELLRRQNDVVGPSVWTGGARPSTGRKNRRCKGGAALRTCS
jgi:hypothetical protein